MNVNFKFFLFGQDKEMYLKLKKNHIYALWNLHKPRLKKRKKKLKKRKLILKFTCNKVLDS